LASRHSNRSSVGTPPAGAKPQKSILKNTGSVSSANGKDDQDSGLPHNDSQQSSTGSYDSSQGRVHYQVDMRPDPTAHRNGPTSRPPRSAYANQGFSHPPHSGRETDIDSDIAPRHQAPVSASRKPPPSSSSRTTPSVKSSSSEGPPRRSLQTYDNVGFDVYDPASIAGQGMLSPTRGLYTMDDMRTPSPSSTSSHQTPRRWGQSGSSNPGYSDDSREKVSVVSELYRDMPQRPGGPVTITKTVTTKREKQHQVPVQSAAPARQPQPQRPAPSLRVQAEYDTDGSTEV